MTQQDKSAADKVVDRGKYPAAPGAHTTLRGGQPVMSENKSLSTGEDGAIVLNDIHLIEKLAAFDREMVPDRIPHAKGHGAFGELHITEDVSQYTKAKLFQKGTVTPMVGRFSTVAGESGSADTARDVHGFALRFYTEDGNYDIVGNNTPVFFMRDPMKFPDFIHSQKRTPDSGLQSADMRWDYWTRAPESAHQVTYLMGDRGTPKSTRHQNGYGSHTFQWINEKGEPVWVKYHFISRQGVENFTDEEATEMGGKNPDLHRQDLFEAIERGDYPIWDVEVQIMPFEDAKTYRFNPFDITKVWSKKDYPRKKIGYFVLNRNPQNFHAQIEQLALDPANLVPGVGLSPDKLLQGRVFAYSDEQRYRIGPNYKQIPVNKPLNQVVTYTHNGAMAYEFPDPSQPPYSPNKSDVLAGLLDDGETSSSMESFEGSEGFYVNSYPEDGDFARYANSKHAEDDDFVQARDLYLNVYDDAAKKRFVSNIAGAMDGVSAATEKRVYEYWANVDKDLAVALEKEFTEGVKAGKFAKPE